MNQLLSIFFSVAVNLSSVHSTFFEGNTEETNLKLFLLTKESKLDSAPELYAFNGLAIMRKAEYTMNPYKKLSFFNDGKTKIEQAVKNSPNNPELRFIRFSVQVNLPSFLNYNSDVKQDAYIVKMALVNKNFSSDVIFAKNVIKFMAESNHISETEKLSLLKLY